MKTFRILFSFIELLIACLVCSSVFSASTSRFETIVFAGLMLIYAGIVGARTTILSGLAEQAKRAHPILQRLPPDDPEIVRASAGHDQPTRMNTAGLFLSMATCLILTLTALWHLVFALILH